MAIIIREMRRKRGGRTACSRDRRMVESGVRWRSKAEGLSRRKGVNQWGTMGACCRGREEGGEKALYV